LRIPLVGWNRENFIFIPKKKANAHGLNRGLYVFGIGFSRTTAADISSRFFMQIGKTNTDNIHIGHLIEEQLKHDERSVSWLARQIPCTRNHVYKILKKSSIDCSLLLRISKAMNFNFFVFYGSEVEKSLNERIGEKAATHF